MASTLRVPASFRLDAPEAPLRLQFGLELVERLVREVASRFDPGDSRSEPSGILYGHSSVAGSVRILHIDAFEPLGRVLPLSAVGLFRGNFRSELQPDDRDLQMLRQRFGTRNAVLLLIDPFAEDFAGAAFFWHDGQMDTEPAWLRLPRRPERAASALRIGGRTATLAALLVCVLAGGFVAYRALSRPSPPAETTAPAASALSLKVEPAGGRLVLTWNGNSPYIPLARRAVLSIRDLGRVEDVDIDVAQLRNGRIEYYPTSTDVSFRLELSGPALPESVSESVRVLGMAVPQVAARLTAELPPAPVPVTSSPPAQGSLGARLRPAAPAPAPRIFQPPPARARNDTGADALSSPPQVAPQPVDVARAAGPRTSAGAPSVPPPAPPTPPAAAAEKPKPEPQPPVVRGGKAEPARVLRQVAPVYPRSATQTRTSGTVRVQATVTADGAVKSASAVSGPMLLRQAAVEAVSQWRYVPAKLNGAPVESRTEVEVVFTQPR